MNQGLTLEGIGVSPAMPASPLQPSQTQSFTATGHGVSNSSVQWSLIPNIGTIAADGVYTAPNQIDSPQTVVVVASMSVPVVGQLGGIAVLNLVPTT